jgi:hypothetical protein
MNRRSFLGPESVLKLCNASSPQRKEFDSTLLVDNEDRQIQRTQAMHANMSPKRKMRGVINWYITSDATARNYVFIVRTR